MALGRYNGWSGLIREKQFNRARRRPEYKNKPGVCEVCGSSAGITYHAEEYGSTFEAYMSHWHALCGYHHGMMHVRARFQNRWRRMLHRLGEGNNDTNIANLGHFFKVIKDLKDLPDSAEPEGGWGLSGIAWLDGMPLVPDKETKIATVVRDGVHRPDPRIYGTGWEHLAGYIVDPFDGGPAKRHYMEFEE